MAITVIGPIAKCQAPDHPSHGWSHFSSFSSTTEEKEALRGPRTQLTEALLGFKCDLEPLP